MPIYEFQCTKCKRIVETIQKPEDPAPKCHGTMKRLMSRNSFRLIGKGWYQTDYRDKPKKGKKDEPK